MENQFTENYFPQINTASVIGNIKLFPSVLCLCLQIIISYGDAVPSQNVCCKRQAIEQQNKQNKENKLDIEFTWFGQQDLFYVEKSTRFHFKSIDTW